MTRIVEAERYKAKEKNKKVVVYAKRFFVVFLCVMVMVAFMGTSVFADNPNGSVHDNIFSEVDYMFNFVQSKFFEISGAAAIIAVGIGIFMKKFSMGRQDKIETGNKLIRDSLIGFLFLNSMPVVIKTMRGLINGTITK